MTLLANIAAVSAAVAGTETNSAKKKTITKFIWAPTVLSFNIWLIEARSDGLADRMIRRYSMIHCCSEVITLQRAGHLVLGIEQFEQFAPSRRCFKMCAIRRDVIPQSLGANK
jgi:hypothetical protein